MTQNTHKIDLIARLNLHIFHLNGLLCSWGDKFSAQSGLTTARWQVLGALALADTPLTAPQIADKMGLSRQGVQKQLNLLMEDGALVPLDNPAHQRSPLYTLSGQGAATFAEINARYRETAEKWGQSFSLAELQAALDTLSKLNEQIRTSDN